MRLERLRLPRQQDDALVHRCDADTACVDPRLALNAASTAALISSSARSTTARWALGTTCSRFLTSLAPSMPRATVPALAFSASVATLPCSVTMPLTVSTLRSLVPMPLGRHECDLRLHGHPRVRSIRRHGRTSGKNHQHRDGSGDSSDCPRLIVISLTCREPFDCRMAPPTPAPAAPQLTHHYRNRAIGEAVSKSTVHSRRAMHWRRSAGAARFAPFGRVVERGAVSRCRTVSRMEHRGRPSSRPRRC